MQHQLHLECPRWNITLGTVAVGRCQLLDRNIESSKCIFISFTSGTQINSGRTRVHCKTLIGTMHEGHVMDGLNHPGTAYSSHEAMRPTCRLFNAITKIIIQKHN